MVIKIIIIIIAFKVFCKFNKIVINNIAFEGFCKMRYPLIIFK